MNMYTYVYVCICVYDDGGDHLTCGPRHRARDGRAHRGDDRGDHDGVNRDDDPVCIFTLGGWKGWAFALPARIRELASVSSTRCTLASGTRPLASVSSSSLRSRRLAPLAPLATKCLARPPAPPPSSQRTNKIN